jgi:hypothetical protein
MSPTPGVVVTTAVRTGPTPALRAPSGQYFTVGITERGPTDAPVKINSMAEYKRTFGDRVSYSTIYDDLAMFFECGGSQAYAMRATGAAATVGTHSFQDSGPSPTLKFDAANPGAWSTRVSVKIENGTNASTKKITVLLDGVAAQIVDNIDTPAVAAQKFLNSPLVKVTDLGSATASPGNLPANAAATALSAGNDDRAAVNAARVEALLPLIKIGLGDGSVSAPGFGAAVHQALIDHADENRRLAILTMGRGTSRDDLATAALALGAANSQPDTAKTAGLFAPWVQVTDGAGGLRALSPEGFVAAARSKAHDAGGPWQPAAGEQSVSPYVLGLDQEFTHADHDVLDVANVNPIRLVSNRIRLYGWNSLSPDDVDYGSLTVGDTLNRITTECETRLEPFVFRTVDGRGQVFSQMRGILIGILEPMRQAGGLYENIDEASGDMLDPGYSVSVAQSDNTTLTLVQNEVHAQVAVRVSPNAEFIMLTITKVGLTAAV